MKDWGIYFVFCAFLAFCVIYWSGPDQKMTANCVSLCGDAGVAKLTSRECDCKP